MDAVVIEGWMWCKLVGRVVLVRGQKLAQKESDAVRRICRQVEGETGDIAEAGEKALVNSVDEKFQNSTDVQVMERVVDKVGVTQSRGRDSLQSFWAEDLPLGEEVHRENAGEDHCGSLKRSHGQIEFELSAVR